MNIMELGAIGEMVGGVAVLVTLIYLALQVRNSAQEQRVSSMREATRELGSIVKELGDTEEKAEIWLRGVREFEAMSAAERFRFNVVAVHFFKLFEQIYYQNREGSVDLELWNGVRLWIRDIAAYPGIQTWWKTRGHWYGENFRAFVESHMSADNQPRLYGERDAAEAR